jgi:excisionase family DNA binding protein
MVDEILRTVEAAQYLNVRKSTLEAWRHYGGGPPFVRYKRAVRYRRSDLEKFLTSRLQVNTLVAAAGNK